MHVCIYRYCIDINYSHGILYVYSVLSNKFYNKVRTLVLGGVAGRVKLTTAQRVLECFTRMVGSICACVYFNK